LASGLGYKVVPTINSGWDPRPRYNGYGGQFYGQGVQLWYVNGTPTDIANNLRNAISWVHRYPSAAEANACLIYAWNEVDEGGWIVPTLSNGTATLDALHQAIIGN
jgi:hypothetical protein